MTTPALTNPLPYSESRRTRRALLDMHPLPLLLAEMQAEAARQERTLRKLEALLSETPIWCIRQRHHIRKAITACQPSAWS